jgi:hypothetical protein
MVKLLWVGNRKPDGRKVVRLLVGRSELNLMG